MDLLTDIFDAITDDELKEVETFLCEDFADLADAFRRKNMDPKILLEHVSLEEMIGYYESIKKAIPDFKIDDYITADLAGPEYYIDDLIRVCHAEPDSIIKIWPHLLNIRRKLELKASPDLIVETEPFIDDTALAVELLERGANPNMVDYKSSLSIEQKIKYGVDPHRFIASALDSDPNLVRKNIGSLLANGLSPIELMALEREFLCYHHNEIYEIFDWYLEQLELFLSYADSDAIFEAFMELVLDIVYSSDLMPNETEDTLFLRAMKRAVELNLVDLVIAVEYLHDIHDEYLEEDDDGNLIPHPSRLLDRDFVLAELTASNK